MNKLVRPLFIVGLVLLFAGAIALNDNPIGVNAQTGCSLETLNGNYIYGYDGFDTSDGGQRFFAFTGRETYNGDGTMTGIFSGTDAAGVVTRNGEYPGVYTVNSNCTGTLTTDPDTEFELNFDIYINEATGDFYFSDVDENILTQGFNQKVQN